MYYPNPKVDRLTQAIIELMPPLRDFFANPATIDNYARQISQYSAADIHIKRQLMFKQLIQQKISRLFTDEERRRIALDWDAPLQAGVVDHHGILNHPVLAGVNITSHYWRLFDRGAHGDILTFATGNVTLNNHFHRRGFQFGGQKVNLFSKADKQRLMYAAPLSDWNIVERLKSSGRWSKLEKADQSFFVELQRQIDAIDFSTCVGLGDQVTKLNFHLWPLLFSPDLRSQTANLISIEYDDIVGEYLIHILESDPNSFVARMLFDQQYCARALHWFEGKTGAWNSERGFGSHWFWGVNSQGEHERLTLDDGILRGKTIRLSWEQASITEALRSKQLLPVMFLKFALILFYMGMKPYAGYGSANYLTLLKHDLANFLRTDYPEEVALFEVLPTNTVTSVPVLLRPAGDGTFQDYYVFDILRTGGLNKNYWNNLKHVPVHYFMAPNLNNIYNYAFNLYGKGDPAQMMIEPADYVDLFQSVFRAPVK